MLAGGQQTAEHHWTAAGQAAVVVSFVDQAARSNILYGPLVQSGESSTLSLLLVYAACVALVV